MLKMFGTALLAMLLVSPLAAQDPAPPAGLTNPEKLSDAAQAFVTRAARSGIFAITASEVAAVRSPRADVKTFARKVVTDQTQVNQTLKLLAGKARGEVPLALDEADEHKVSQLKNEPIERFDAMYVATQEKAHQHVIPLFRSYLENGENEDLKSFAEKTLTMLEDHAAKVEQLGRTTSSSN